MYQDPEEIKDHHLNKIVVLILQKMRKKNYMFRMRSPLIA